MTEPSIPLDLDAIRREWTNQSAEHEQDLLLAISDACCGGCDVSRFVPKLLAEIDRLRNRVHEAVDECQRRHAKYVSRCADFTRWSAWARKRFEDAGSTYWSMTSEADRLVIDTFLDERDKALAEAEQLRNHLRVARSCLWEHYADCPEDECRAEIAAAIKGEDPDRAEWDRLRGERDEAGAEVERLRAELDAGEFQWGWLSADQVRVYQSPSEQDARRAAGRSGARRLMRRRRGPWVDVPGEVPDASS